MERAFKNLYPLKSSDVLADLGCGNGKVLAMATKFGAKGIGIELNPLFYLVAKLRLRKNKKATVKFGDMFRMKLPDDTTVIYVFGVERDGERLYTHLQNEAKRLGRDLVLISYATPIKNRHPDKKFEAYYLFEIKN